MTKTAENKPHTPKVAGEDVKLGGTTDCAVDGKAGCTTDHAKDAKAGAQAPVKIVTKDELKRRMDKHDKFQLVNVLDASGYALGVIKGSLKIPLAELDKRAGELDKAQDVVTYCADSTCDASKAAAQLLAGKGFKVSAYEGGAKEWKAAGLPQA
jgi:rhodanese-related sulfurtransferase